MVQIVDTIARCEDQARENIELQVDMTIEYVVAALALVAYEHTVCVRLDCAIHILCILAVLVVHIHCRR